MKRTVASVMLVMVVLVAGVAPAAAAGSSSALGGAGPAQTSTQDCSYPVSVTDATGTNVTVDSEPQRVVALGASTAQIMWEIGAKGKVVGMPVDSTTAYLNGSTDRTDTFQSDGYTVATERVVGLNPDLVIAPNVIPNSTVNTLRRAGLTVYKSDFGESYADIYADTNRTGRLVGACDGARSTVETMQSDVGAVQDAVGNDSTPSALYLLSGGYVAGNGTFIGDVLETAGASNLAATAGIQNYKQISPEVVASRNPDWLVTSNRSVIPGGAAYSGTTAITENQTVTVGENYISQPGPRVVIPLVRIATALHPDAMAAADLSNTSVDGSGSAVGSVTPVGNASLNTTATNASAANTSMAGGSGTSMAGSSTMGTAMTSNETAASGNGGTPLTNQATTAGTGGSGGEAGASATTGGANGSGGATSSSNGDGFGVVVAAVALLGAGLLARRRR